MAVTTEYAAITYTGNDSTTAFPVTWQFFEDEDIVVTSIVIATEVETVKTLTTHYTVSGGIDSNGLPATGTVTMLTAPASTTNLRIERTTEKLQESTWDENDAFPEATIEAALDRCILLSQEAVTLGDVQELVTLASEYLSDITDLAEAAEASAEAAAESASDASDAFDQIAALLLQDGTDLTDPVLLDSIAASFNGVTTSFALALSTVAFTPDSAAQLIVHVNNVYQIPGTAYTVSTSNISFTGAPASGDTCTIVAMANQA